MRVLVLACKQVLVQVLVLVLGRELGLGHKQEQQQGREHR